MKTRPLLLIAVCLFTSGVAVSAQDYSYNENSQTRGIETYAERVTLDIAPVKARILDDRETALPVIGALAAPLIDVGISAVKARLAKTARQYLATYNCANSGERFYDSRQFANLPQLTITRSITIPDRHATDGMKLADALIIVLVPELSSDRHAFRYSVKLVNMGYAKARTRGKFDFIDVQLDVVFRALSIEGPKQQIVNLRAFSLVIPAVKPNQVYDASNVPRSSWIPFPPAPQPTKGVADFAGTGNYEFHVAVTESNVYKVRAENKQFVMDKSSDALSTLAEEIGKLIEKDKK